MSAAEWKGLAAAALTGSVVGKAVADLGEVQKAELLEQVIAAGLEQFRIKVVGDGGEVYGSVSLRAGAQTVKVTDERALVKFVQAEHPTEIVPVPTVRPAFLKLLQEAVKSGRVVPGLTLVEGDPVLAVTATSVARDQAARLTAGQPSSLPGLEGTHTDTGKSRPDEPKNDGGGP